MATVKKSSKKIRTPNPTLHGLLVARNFSGTVVRTLLLLLLTGGLVFVAGTVSSTTSDSSAVSGLAVLGIAGATYLVFDVVYVIMSRIRPLHPRLDRVVLPLGLIFALLTIYGPLFISNTQSAFVTGVWMTGAIMLLCVLGVRFALLLASKK